MVPARQRGLPGRVMQNGYVVRDFEEAAMFWVETFGIGPFFLLRHIEFQSCRFRGIPTDADLTVAIAYTGDFQIELVQQHDDAPSIYKEWLETHPPGLQHIGTLVDDLDAVLDGNGWREKIVQDGRTAAGQRFAYVDTVLHDGTMIELIEPDQAMTDAFEHMRRASINWDGTNPLRG